ncbi:MAG: ABC transporter ATP-binding protein [Schleiferiaceae bacterium]|nr:ABC transporter ATP-binding protein [Schleiferiaceae bacterium]
MNILSIANVSKHYGDYQALSDITIEVPTGSIYGLLGPNGAGKTSLIRIINQITAPDSGQVFFNGKPLAPHHVTKIGYLPEERGLYRKMEVGEQALYLAQLKGLSKAEAKKRLKYWFEKFDITSWWGKKVEELSKGMAQKVQFIVTVLHEPELLIFDEPFSGFDPINTNLIKAEIQELNKKGASIIFSTHRMESVEEICEHIALIHQSKKILEGRVDAIRKQYSNNTFEIGFSQPLTALSQLPENIDAQLSADGTKGVFALPESLTPNDLLPLLLPQAQIVSMREVIPSVNDIFIQAVGGSSVE